MRADNTVPGHVNPQVSLTNQNSGTTMLDAIVGLLGTVLVGVIAWAWHFSQDVQTRLAVLEADKVSLKELLNTKLEIINDRLARIEEKLDK